jgi:methyl-accepting chemotaxis protein
LALRLAKRVADIRAVREEPMGKERRRKTNLLLQPGLQLKLPLLLLIITLGFAALQVAHTQFAYGKLFEIVLQEAGRPPFLEDLLRDQTGDFIEVTGALTVLYVLLIIVLSVVYAHRMIGPTVALRRQIEAMKNGDYDARVTLRQRDAFSDLAEDLNELARVLEEHEKLRGPSAQTPGEA